MGHLRSSCSRYVVLQRARGLLEPLAQLLQLLHAFLQVVATSFTLCGAMVCQGQRLDQCQTGHTVFGCSPRSEEETLAL